MLTLPLNTLPLTQHAYMEHKRRFLYMWRNSLVNDRARRWVLEWLGRPETAHYVHTWVEEDRVAQIAVEASGLAALSAQRSALRGVSRLLERMCDLEGLALGAVAHGVLPTAHCLQPGEGYPWVPFDSEPARAAVRRSYTSRLADRWEHRFYRSGAFIRPRDHSAGRWAVGQVRGVLHTSFAIGPHLVRSCARGVARIDLKLRKDFPETVKGALPGRRMGAVIDCQLLDDPTFIIRRVQDIPGGLRIFFECPEAPITMALLVSSPPTGSQRLQQLGRDSSLSGDDAVRDVLLRASSTESASLTVSRYYGHASEWFRRADRARIRTINLMAPPWAEHLPIPD